MEGCAETITIGLYYRVVSTFDLAPLHGRIALESEFPGLKPWAEWREDKAHLG